MRVDGKEQQKNINKNRLIVVKRNYINTQINKSEHNLFNVRLFFWGLSKKKIEIYKSFCGFMKLTDVSSN